MSLIEKQKMRIRGGSMKALEFLKDIQEDTPCKWEELDEVIAELEELQNISCEGCVHNLSANRSYPLTCLDCSGFYADKYIKENK